MNTNYIYKILALCTLLLSAFLTSACEDESSDCFIEDQIIITAHSMSFCPVSNAGWQTYPVNLANGEWKGDNYYIVNPQGLSEDITFSFYPFAFSKFYTEDFLKDYKDCKVLSCIDDECSCEDDINDEDLKTIGDVWNDFFPPVYYEILEKYKDYLDKYNSEQTASNE